ncbi:O-antigen ligase family protein [Bradyrhizobium sp. 173]|uniref:O-antigen ligase family protein n=1 Tax=Bradyrhizobium sp. 173 TaxID=2782644 RepID=UPI001FFAC632|nr:O-antigen ligase family protein [Bradyrhizobium sp. 173]MCK1568770.1 O-antigen ligase family protein [Bradyrhizobium sp. 173]
MAVTVPETISPASRKGLLLGRWNGWPNLVRLIAGTGNEPGARDLRIGMIDASIVALALVFPWSTTATTALGFLICLTIATTYSAQEIIGQLKRPALALPATLLALAVVGTAWAHGIPWTDRLHAFGKVSKFICFLPFFVHFKHTYRVRLVFTAYVVSNLLLLALSFLVFLSPDIYGVVGAKAPGVPLKNYIDQTQAFAFIAVVFVALVIEAVRQRQRGQAILFAALSVAFFVNLAFVNIARTAFIYLPAMLALVVIRYARGWYSLAIMAAIAMLAAGAWAISPNLQFKTARLLGEVDAFQANTMFVNGTETGGAERLEFWRKSIGFIEAAPMLGHGTGATKRLFAAESAGKTGLMAKVVDNPHNQTLAVAIQWGIVGCLVLYAMWGAHLLLFRGAFSGQQCNVLAWIGLVAVTQNIVSSLLNSHLFDFYQGWLYLFAVAMIGGQLQRQQAPPRANADRDRS